MWWNVGPHLRRRMKVQAGEDISQERTTSSFFSTAESDVDEFRQVLKRKFGSVTRAWRVGLDEDASGILDFYEFCAATKAIGYTGNLRSLWYNMDIDHSGNISLKELDEVAAKALEKFRYLSTKRYETMEGLWMKLLDQDRSGFVGYAEFSTHVRELGYVDDEEIWDLFTVLLIKPGSTSLTYDDIKFLQSWDDRKRAEVYRKRLPVGWVNKDPQFYGPPEVPGTPSEDNHEFSVSIDVNQEQEDFRQFLIQRYGSLCNAFDVMDANSSGALSLVEFQSVVSTVLRYCRPTDARRLFLSFNEDPGAMLTWDELGISAQDWMNHLLQKRTKQRKTMVLAMQNATAPLGSSLRMTGALQHHVTRLRVPKKREDIAFWTPMPAGWGRPPSFEPVSARKA